MPLQFVHMKTPKFNDAHLGRRIGQSTHRIFSGRFRHGFMRFMSASCARSAAIACVRGRSPSAVQTVTSHENARDREETADRASENSQLFPTDRPQFLEKEDRWRQFHGSQTVKPPRANEILSHDMISFVEFEDEEHSPVLRAA